MHQSRNHKRRVSFLAVGAAGAALVVGVYGQVASGSQSPREQFCTAASNNQSFVEEFRGSEDSLPGRFIADVKRSLASVQKSDFRDVGEHATVIIDYATAFEAKDSAALDKTAEEVRAAQAALNTVAEEECGVTDAF